MLPNKNETNYVVVQDPLHDRWLCFRNPLQILETSKIGEVRNILAKIEDEVTSNGMYAAGFVSYEASPAFDSVFPAKTVTGMPLIWFGLYEDFSVFDFPDKQYVEESSNTEHRDDSLNWNLLVEEDEYISALKKIKTYIKEGDAYQVNYSFRLKADCTVNHWLLFVQMVHAQNLADQPGYCVYVDTAQWTVCSASPELFFDHHDRILRSKPMKGTAPRGYGYQDDFYQGQNLQRSEKNRAENIMIADMVRNDMGRIADVGTVKTTDILALEKYPTFWTMTTTVQCESDFGVVSVFDALFPAASITGAPKLRSMEIIDELEKFPRHIYTGTAGYITPDKFAQFNVAIRTVLIDKNNQKAKFGVGGGIVWDSRTGDEYQECHTKARVLTYLQPRFDLIETFKWNAEDGYIYLKEHLTRLENSSYYFSWSLDMKKIEQVLNEATSTFPKIDQRVRLQVSKSGKVKIENSDFKNSPEPYVVKVANNPINSKNYFLYHKTTIRSMYENALSSQAECNDVLLWNEKGELTESCRANLVIENKNGLITPPISCGLLNGIGRQDFLDKGLIRESIIDVDQLLSAKSAWLINSVRDRWQVILKH